MKIAIGYDTETTGLPNWSMPSEDPSQPRVMSLAAQLFDDATGVMIDEMDVLIKPDGWEIPELIANLTGITTEMCEATGVPMEQALNQFVEMWKRADHRVAHNDAFDMRMIRIEIMRHPTYSMEKVGEVSFADYWKKAPAYCTMVNSTKLVNLPPTEKMIRAGRRTPKSPNMTEAYRFFTGKELENAHSARADMEACKAVYFGIRAATTPPADRPVEAQAA